VWLISGVNVQADDLSGDEDDVSDYGAELDDNDDANDADADDDDDDAGSDVDARGDVLSSFSYIS